MSFDLSARTTIAGGPVPIGSVFQKFHHRILDPRSISGFGTSGRCGASTGAVTAGEASSTGRVESGVED